ncbi:DUF5110 domain-containing protein [Defluviitalea raffinosedens]|uniref:DUF5110 domain-containing protein n=2 Tax=Defluviitalea raffinosedens TaxID=1450156 RepID=A0A7C8HGX4_9FIRM|nr:glycoside hydrolase family 31 protein [Defluviitalea raffinosedens]KAE9636249.1 DUF5110 domain-containing protein [Defluviitalea raffinosedens]MBM7685464.1 alpha-glucosidase (family GH31 glycosyl hydrolase) [Defluviitalea raffinosedens]
MRMVYRFETNPLCIPENVVQGDCYRFTILTPYLIRMEYDEKGKFEDRASQTVINRNFEPQNFQVMDDEQGLQIITEGIHLTYDKKKFSPNGLTVKVKGNLTAYHSVWHYLDPVKDLGGTARTLDEADGPVKLEPGVLSRNGFSVLDDSKSFLIGEDGWPVPRENDSIDLYFFGYGRNYLRCLKDFYRLTGFVPLLPKYALGNWWSRYYPYTEESYKKLIEHFEEEKIPLTVAVLDMDWHLVDIPSRFGSGWTGYTWNKELFPDPKGFMDWLHKKGYHITLNVHPADGVRAHEEMYEDMAKELGVDYKNEIPIQFDLTDPDFVKAYFKYLHHPNEEAGVDFWWIDWQQGSKSKIEGLDPLWMLNHFHYLDMKRNGKRSLILSRYAGVGSHRYPIGFSGDTVISWESLRFQPYFTATASNIGFCWWSHDIGGHMFGKRDDELITRWLQFGIFSPIMRLHSTRNLFAGKEPWRYNAIAHEVMNNFLRLRHNMIPYLYTMNYRCHMEAEPLIQPMYYQYPERDEAYEVKNQYYFGSELIVAPVTDPMDPKLQLACVKVWLPEGIYIDFFNGRIYDGDRYVEMYRGLDTIPVLAKAGAIIPMRYEETYDNDLGNPMDLNIRVFAGDSGHFSLYEDDGISLDYTQGACVKTDMYLDWQEGVFCIKGAKGKLDLIPQKRNYRLSFVGFADCDEISVELDGDKIPYAKSYDMDQNTLIIDLEGANVTKELKVQFGQKLNLAVNNIEKDLYHLLNQAQIEYQLKEKIYFLIKNQTDRLKTISQLHSWNLPHGLFGMLCELILAR